MLQIELVPDLSHCIETVAKRKHTEIVQKLLAPGAYNDELQETLEILRLFLEAVDFKKLRKESERHLMESKIVRFLIYLKDGVPKYDMIVT